MRNTCPILDQFTAPSTRRLRCLLPLPPLTALPQVLKVMRGEHLPIPDQFTAPLRDLAKQLLSKVPKLRPSAEQCLKMPLLKVRGDGREEGWSHDNMSRCEVCGRETAPSRAPKLRPSAEQCLKMPLSR